MPCAFSRRSASPVRITAPVSTSLGLETGAVIGVLDDLAELDVVDAGLAGIGREGDGREIERLAGDDVIAAGQVFGETAQMDAREDDLRAGGADIDADAGQVDIVLHPERIFLDRPVDVEFVVVVIGIAIMLVGPAGAHAMMLGQAVGLFLIVVVVHHKSQSPFFARRITPVLTRRSGAACPKRATGLGGTRPSTA